MKIGILTFHAAHNYGSMLLAFALQEALRNLGHEVKIINYRNALQNQMYANPLKFKHKIHIQTLLRHPIFFTKKYKKWMSFERFSSEYHHLTRRVSDLVGIENVINDEKFDAVIAGGDQIWNMQCYDFSIAYYLPFDITAAKKISYSPSFGGGGNFKVSHYSNAIKGLLADFDHLSVREKNTANEISELLNRSIASVCDPVMLLDKSVYEKLAGQQPLIKGKYIFYYSPFSSPDKEQLAMDYGRKMGLPVFTSNAEYFQCKGMKKFLNAGPKEFINLIRNAELVCGNSFHLLAFSILMNKDFIIFSKADHRMENLMKKLHISGHIYEHISEIPSKLPPIDWTLVNESLMQEKEMGLDYLKQSTSLK